jgi:hypothetical protein
MAEETQYTANSGLATISTANANLDGSGTLSTVLTGSANGTLVKSVCIKAQVTTTRGMVRLFVYNGTNSFLLKEIDIYPIAQSSTSPVNPSFETKINLNFILKSGYILKASTQNGQTFSVIAEGMNIGYYASAVREDTTQFTANTSIAKIATANSNLDGTGTIGTAYTAGSSPTYIGSSIETITIKGTVTSTPGMVRIFIYNGTTYYLITEVLVPSIVPDGTDQSFKYTISFNNSFDLQSGYSIAASTQNAQNFNVLVQGKDWNYAS